MTFEPKHIERWTLPESYAGERWPDYFSAGVGQSRESDALERSNFRCMLARLGGESETVIVVREGHWAVGWVEWIAIHYEDDRALRIADEIKGGLADYPVVDENDWCEEERQEADEVWRFYTAAERVAYIRDHRDQFEFHDFADMLGCARGRYFCGYASVLLG